MKSEKSTILKLSDLSFQLGVKDRRTVLRWLTDSGIHFWKIGKEYVTDRWMVELHFELKKVENLKCQYPHRWEQLYRSMCDDNRMLKVIFQLNPPISTRQITKSNSQKYFNV